MFDGAGNTRTAAEIAASVRRPARLMADEAELAALRKRSDEISDEIRRLNEQRGFAASFEQHEFESAAHDLDAERNALADKIAPVRRRVVEARPIHGAAVRKALLPSIGRAAERAHAAAAELQASLGELEAINRELLRANGEQVSLLPPDLEGLLARLGRLAGRG
jgi:hypothetical protein